jgi:hypothetical protein
LCRSEHLWRKTRKEAIKTNIMERIKRIWGRKVIKGSVDKGKETSGKKVE